MARVNRFLTTFRDEGRADHIDKVTQVERSNDLIKRGKIFLLQKYLELSGFVFESKKG